MATRVGRWLVASFFACVGASAAVADDIDRQIRFWEARRDADPEDDISPTKLGTAYLLKARRGGDYSYYLKAEAALRRAVEINPRSYDARVSLAFALGAQHKFRDAIALAERAVKDRPGEPEAYGILGDAALETGDLGRAESAYATLEELAPGLFAFGRIANLRQAKGDGAGALAALARAIELGKARGAPEDEIARCQVAIGEIHWGHGRLDEAERHYRAALEITPEGYLPLEHLAELLAARKDHAEALRLYRKAIAAAPHPDFFEAVGAVYAAMGRPEEAESWRDRALAGYRAMVERGDIGYYRHLARFYCDVRPDHAEALKWARRDMEVRRDPLTYDTLAWAYDRNGQFAPAAEAIGKALASGTDDASILFHAGMIHLHNGDTEAARKSLRRALASNPRLAGADEARAALRRLDDPAPEPARP
jgi:tetratricopeptide (TPR) repeat protein